MKYQNVNWPEGTPVTGERLATNGVYTGQQKGTPTQDAAAGADNEAYPTARATEMQGTLTPDAADTNFPQKAV